MYAFHDTTSASLRLSRKWVGLGGICMWVRGWFEWRVCISARVGYECPSDWAWVNVVVDHDVPKRGLVGHRWFRQRICRIYATGDPRNVCQLSVRIRLAQCRHIDL